MRRLGAIIVLALAAPAAAQANQFLITGHGWGHGVGMSQYGAEGLAIHGWDFRRILAHYYPGTRLERQRRSPRVRVLLAEDRREVVVSARSPFLAVDAHGRRHHVKRRLVLRVGHIGWPSPLRIEAGAARLNRSGRVSFVAVHWRGGVRVLSGRTVQARLSLPSTWFRIQAAKRRA